MTAIVDIAGLDAFAQQLSEAELRSGALWGCVVASFAERQGVAPGDAWAAFPPVARAELQRREHLARAAGELDSVGRWSFEFDVALRAA